VERQYVGIDFHRRRSVIVRLNAAGERLAVTRVDNDPLAISATVAEAGPEPEVVIEATYGWVRHEAPCDRVGCKDHLWPVAAGRGSWRQPDLGDARKGGSSLDNAGAGWHYQTARVRQARRRGVRVQEPVVEPPQEVRPARTWWMWAGIAARRVSLHPRGAASTWMTRRGPR
jgi:hypothetical protein